MADASREQLLGSVKDLFSSGKYSDLKITCGDDTYNVHKAVVCSRSGFMERAVSFGGREAQDGEIDLPDDERIIIKLLMYYLYGAEYDPVLPADRTPASSSKDDGLIIKKAQSYCDRYGRDYAYEFPHTCPHPGRQCPKFTLCPHHVCGDECRNWSCRDFVCDICTEPAPPLITGTEDQLIVHAKMYEIADKYDVVGLKELSKKKFHRACVAFWDTPSFAVAAYHAFTTTIEDDKGLRDIVANCICKHMNLIYKAEVRALMTEFNGLAFGILLEKAEEHGWGKK